MHAVDLTLNLCFYTATTFVQNTVKCHLFIHCMRTRAAYIPLCVYKDREGPQQGCFQNNYFLIVFYLLP